MSNMLGVNLNSSVHERTLYITISPCANDEVYVSIWDDVRQNMWRSVTVTDLVDFHELALWATRKINSLGDFLVYDG